MIQRQLVAGPRAGEESEAYTVGRARCPDTLQYAVIPPTVATALSVVIPGGGQIYAGQPVKGGLILIGTGTALATSVAVAKLDPYFGCPDPCWEFDTTPLLVGAGIARAIWLYGVLDAPGAAQRANRRSGLASLELAPVLLADRGQHHAGMQIRASF